jgi:hypothetical protein
MTMLKSEKTTKTFDLMLLKKHFTDETKVKHYIHICNFFNKQFFFFVFMPCAAAGASGPRETSLR